MCIIIDHACDLACIVSMYLDVRPVLYLYYGICAMPPYYACVRNTTQHSGALATSTLSNCVQRTINGLESRTSG